MDIKKYENLYKAIWKEKDDGLHMFKEIITLLVYYWYIFIWFILVIILLLIWVAKTEAKTPWEVGYMETGKFWVRGYEWGNYAFELQDKLKQLWYSDNDTVIIINNCKKSTVNVWRCIRTAGMIGFAESWWWNRCRNNNCMGLYTWNKAYKNTDEMFKEWIKRYNRYWYKHPEPHKYYWYNPLTKYCYNPDGACENWLRNSTYAFKLLNSEEPQNWIDKFKCKQNFSIKCQIMSLCWAYDYPGIYNNYHECTNKEFNLLNK